MLLVDGVRFVFEPGWKVSKYDDWSYYRNQFARIGDVKAVDLLAVSPSSGLWLIEVKDYRFPGTLPPRVDELCEAVCAKVLHTLAALLPGSLRANDDVERAFAADCCQCTGISVAVHIEQPAKRSALFPRGPIDLANLAIRLRQRLKAVDPRVKVFSADSMAGAQWVLAAEGTIS